MLAFFNQCLIRAAGKHEVTATVIRESEREYSTGRFQALVDEWKGAFPSLPIVLNFVAQGGSQLTFGEIRHWVRCEDLVLRILGDESLKDDPLYPLAEKVLAGGDDGATDDLMRVTVETLYRIGSIGVKPENSEAFLYSHADSQLLTRGALTDGAKVRIHPMLMRALSVKDD